MGADDAAAASFSGNIGRTDNGTAEFTGVEPEYAGFVVAIERKSVCDFAFGWVIIGGDL